MKPQVYGPFDYSPIIQRKKLQWPNGARLALWVIPNVEFFPLDKPIPGGSGKAPDLPSWTIRDYGNRIGVFRFMELFDRYGIRATAALNSDVCLHHPVIIEEGNKRGWEWMGHNQTNSQRLIDVPESDEPGLIKATFATIEKVAGRRPKGWLSSGLQETWNTLDLLAAEGLEYICDWTNDDQPYLMTLESGKKLVSVPYSMEINDMGQMTRFLRSTDEFRDMICRQFDTLYREGAQSGRVMAICLHPFLMGVPHRIGALEAALQYICSHAGIWLTTGGEIARHYLSQI